MKREIRTSWTVILAAALLFCFTVILSLSKDVYAGTIELPKTGQTTKYADGDDGDLQKGVAWPSPRFTDNNDGTVTDNLTGLVWLRDANCTDTVGGVSKSGSILTWLNALTWSNNLANGSCGLTDGSTAGQWRLPNINELESLVHAGYNEENCGGTACSTLAAWLNTQGFSNVQANWHWSSTTDAYNTGSAWSINMSYGSVNRGDKAGGNYVWPVRADSASLWKTGQTTSFATGDDGALQKGAAWPSPNRFTAGTGAEVDCVTDNLTGLMWSKNGNLPNGTRTWQNALDYANALNLCGYTDWRLPNRKELFSLIHYGQSNPATWLNTQGFSNVQTVQTDWYWSSTTLAFSTVGAWFLNMSYGNVDGGYKPNGNYVWPVRAGSGICTPPPANMVSWWKAENNGNDSIGTNHGTLMNGATFATGKVGQAFSFDGVNDYVEIAHSSSFDITTGHTVDMWIKLNELPAGPHGIAPLISKWVTAAEDKALEIRWDGKIQYRLVQVGIETLNILSNSSLTTGVWYHIAATYDGSSAKIYINGVLDKSETAAISVSNSTGKVYLGYHPFRFDGGPWVPYSGLMDEVEWFNRALTAEEIAAIYACVDTTPDQFTFTDQTDVPVSSVRTSNTITVSGINSATSISITSCTGTNCEYQINGGSWTSGAGTVLNGDTVTVRQTSSASYSTTTDLTLDIGGVTDTFSVTTIAPPQRTLTVNKTGTGTGTVTAGANCALNWVGNTGTCTVNHGTAITLSGSADAGSAFAGWSGGTGSASGCTGTGDCTFNITADSGVTATFSLTYSITGRIVNVLGGPLPNISVSLSGAVTTTVITNAQGVYIFTNLFPGSYTITPSSAFHTFTPSSRSVNITNSNITEQNFTAMRSRTITGYTISGSITSGGIGLSGVVVNLTGAGNATIATDANGNYIFRGLSNGNYTVTPSLTGYAFAPTSRDVTINNANITGVNFTATFIGGTGDYSISGRITNVLGGPARGVTVRLTTAVERIAVTNANGEYIFTNLASGNYRVTPSRTGLTFTPAYRDITITNANITGVNFSANRVR